MRTNEVLMDLYREPDIISEIIKVRLRWLGHVEGMPEDRTTRNTFKNFPEGKSPLQSQDRDGWLMSKMI